MSITYTYQIISVDEAARCMEVVYTSAGRQTMHIGARLPFQNESLEDIVQLYAPVRYWEEQATAVSVPAAGTTGQVALPEPPPVTLESAKAEKLAAIAAWRYMREAQGVRLNGSMIKTDRESQGAVAGAYANLKNGLISTVNWKTESGEFVTFDLAQMTAVAQAVALHVQDCFTKERALAAQVAAAMTLEAVQAIEPATVSPEDIGAIPTTTL